MKTTLLATSALALALLTTTGVAQARNVHGVGAKNGVASVQAQAADKPVKHVKKGKHGKKHGKKKAA